MSRNVTITFADGSSHVYENAPDNLTPDMAEARALKDFGKQVVNLDGGKASTRTNVSAEEPSLVTQGIEAFKNLPRNATLGTVKGFKDVTDTGVKLGASALDYISPNQPTAGAMPLQPSGSDVPMVASQVPMQAPVSRRAQINALTDQQTQQYNALVGENPVAGAFRFGGNVLATLPVLGAVAAPLKTVAATYEPALAPLAESIASGGFKTGLTKATTKAEKLAELAYKATGGAVANNFIAGAINPDEFGTVGTTALGAAGPLVLPTVAKALASSFGWTKDLVTGKLGELKAAKIIIDTLGDNFEAAKAALAKAPPNINATQALHDAGINADAFMALGKFAASKDANSVYRLLAESQEKLRQEAIKKVTPDLAGSIAARDVLSDPLYKKSKEAIVTLDQPMLDIFERMPAGTLDAAKNIARMEGKPFIMGEYIPAVKAAPATATTPAIAAQPAQYPQTTGQSLHYIKRALSDISNTVDPTKGIGKDAQNAARGVLADFLPLVEHRVPSYGEARKAFAGASAPVNQSQVLNAMADVLKKPSGGERVNAFLNVLEGAGEAPLLKRSTGYARYGKGDLEKVLTGPEQMATVKDVASQLQRDINVEEQAKAGTGALARIFDKEQGWRKIPNMFNRATNIANRALDVMENQVSNKTMDTFIVGFQSGKNIAEIVSTLPSKEQSEILKLLRNSDRWNKEVAIGAGQLSTERPVNNLAPSQQQPNQNALAR